MPIWITTAISIAIRVLGMLLGYKAASDSNVVAAGQSASAAATVAAEAQAEANDAGMSHAQAIQRLKDHTA